MILLFLLWTAQNKVEWLNYNQNVCKLNKYTWNTVVTLQNNQVTECYLVEWTYKYAYVGSWSYTIMKVWSYAFHGICDQMNKYAYVDKMR